MANQQLYTAIGIPMLFNAAMMGLLILYINTRFASFARSINQRFDDMRDL